jgi:acetate kinase
MLILVVNCGSSSIKYDLFDVGKERSLCRGGVERIGERSSVLKYEADGNGSVRKEVDCPDHHRAVEIVRDALVDPEKGVLSDVSQVEGVGHRVVHGGEEFCESVLIDDSVIDSIEKYAELAPLHNPPCLEGIRGCMKIFEGVPQAAVFDTAFHHSMPERAYLYGIPYEYYEKYRIRRYGFHGTSHRYVAQEAAQRLGKPLEEVSLITVHLGNGCSIAAVSGGRVMDTSMGFTPLEGLVMGTRSGDVDPAVPLFLMDREDLDEDGMNDLLNKKSGLLGLSGISNDMRDILECMEDGGKRAELAYEVFVYRILKYIGAYAAVLGSVDAVVFTAGIGENVPRIKEEVSGKLSSLLSGTEFLTINTNEELLIARDTLAMVRG